MKEFILKYGCNPNQTPARSYSEEGDLPVEILNGRPGYINFLDALNGWQLVREIKGSCRQYARLCSHRDFETVAPIRAICHRGNIFKVFKRQSAYD